MPNEPTSAARVAPRETRFSLAANYDSELVPALAAYPVDEVYGKFPDITVIAPQGSEKGLTINQCGQN